MESQFHLHNTNGGIELDVQTAPGEEFIVGSFVDLYTPTGSNDHLQPASTDPTGEIRRTLAPDVRVASLEQALGRIGGKLLFD